MYVLVQDGVRPCCRDSHVSCTPKPVLCFGVRTAFFLQKFQTFVSDTGYGPMVEVKRNIDTKALCVSDFE